MEKGLRQNAVVLDEQHSTDFFDELMQAIIAVIVIFLVTGVMVLIGRSTLGEGVIAMIYLIPITLSTTRWGKLAGLSAAIAAGLAFDYCFIPPFGTFSIGSIEGWLILIFFMTTSVLIVDRIQSLLLKEKKSEHEAIILFELANAIADMQTREAIAKIVAEKIQQLFLASFVQVDFYNKEKKPTVIITAKGGLPSQGKPNLVLPIWADERMLGSVTIWKGILPLPDDQDYMLQGFMRQTARVLMRIDAAEESNNGIKTLHGSDSVSVNNG
jgi:K+-sensing histidine kinase KdpD